MEKRVDSIQGIFYRVFILFLSNYHENTIKSRQNGMVHLLIGGLSLSESDETSSKTLCCSKLSNATESKMLID